MPEYIYIVFDGAAEGSSAVKRGTAAASKGKKGTVTNNSTVITGRVTAAAASPLLRHRRLLRYQRLYIYPGFPAPAASHTGLQVI